ncbi:MAG: hypothetical protein A7316_02435 [Candidatus Altiarchaeales archaeon WOR_SM1_86-2]|nr:MAG: hypothetical protein A7316_02435 [Candidatus Altiarchaeales archaeon WOR_SM1_86-2]
MKLVIGLVGRIGSGKGAVTEHLCSGYGASRHVISDILADVLDRLYLPRNRENLQALGKALRAELGSSVIVDALKKDIEGDNAGIIVVDGIRYVNEVEMLRCFDNNLLVSIDAPPEVRYERCKIRGQKNETNITFEEFLNSGKQETEKYIGETEKLADYRIDNSGSLKDLHEKVNEILSKYNL